MGLSYAQACLLFRLCIAMCSPLDELMEHGRRESDSFAEPGGNIFGVRGSAEGSGGIDLDVDMDEVAAIKASEIRNEGKEKEAKKKNEGHFELPNLRGYGAKIGLRPKKDDKSPQPGALPAAEPEGANQKGESNTPSGTGGGA